MRIIYDESKPNEWRDALVHEPAESCKLIALLQGCETGTIIKKDVYFDSEVDGYKADEHTKISNAWNVLVWRFKL